MRRVVAVGGALALMAAPAFAKTCPMDRTTFVEKTTKAEFIADKVAVAYRYLCRGNADKVYVRPQKKLEDTCDGGPYGETYLSGKLGGKPVIAVYSVEKAAPCCYWRSYAPDDKAIKTKRLQWLKAGAPTLELGSEWLTIGPDNPPWPPDTGPLKGGTYVTAVCRAK
jgi:hypothetical protein